MSMNRKRRRALRGEEFKITPRGDYDATRAEVNEDGMTVLLAAFRSLLKGSPEAEEMSDQEVFDGHVELIRAGFLDVYIRYRGAGIEARCVLKIPGMGSLDDLTTRSVQ